MRIRAKLPPPARAVTHNWVGFDLDLSKGVLGSKSGGQRAALSTDRRLPVSKPCKDFASLSTPRSLACSCSKRTFLRKPTQLCVKPTQPCVKPTQICVDNLGFPTRLCVASLPRYAWTTCSIHRLIHSRGPATLHRPAPKASESTFAAGRSQVCRPRRRSPGHLRPRFAPETYPVMRDGWSGRVSPRPSALPLSKTYPVMRALAAGLSDETYPDMREAGPARCLSRPCGP